MALVIPRGLPYHPHSIGPVWGATWSVEDGWKVVVKCVNGHPASLVQHQIDACGVVTPSLVCPEDGCDWHEWVQLGAWAAGG